MIARRAAGLVAAALLLGACGLPTSTDPKYLGPAATVDTAQDRAAVPPKPDGATSAWDLATRFLQTSVGANAVGADQADAPSETQTRMRTFLTPQRRIDWQPGKALNVVRVSFDPERELGAGAREIVAHFQPVGVLSSAGQLEATESGPWTATFRAELVDGQYRLAQVPNGMFLSLEGLSQFYDQRPIYFWESGVDAPKLVPDLRYMPTVVPSSKRVNEVMAWLRNGPSSWLSPVVKQLPSEIETKDSAIVGADGVTVNLSPKASGLNGDELRRLASQIRWSLADHRPVSLAVDGREIGDSGGFENDNAAYGQGETNPPRYCVVQGVARPAEISVSGPPALFAPGGANASVVNATINRAETRAALVRQVDKNTQQLFVSATDATTANPPKYIEVKGVKGARLSRPVWISRPAQRFLIADGTQLFEVVPPPPGEDAAQAQAVPGPSGPVPTGISSFAVAPDGRRIAFIANGALMVAPVKFDGSRLSLGLFRPVETTLGDNQAVGWLTETTLAVGGKPSPTQPREASYSLVSITVDGTAETPLPRRPTGTAGYEISQMSVRTEDPLGHPLGLILVESNQVANTLYNEGIAPIQLKDARQAPASAPAQTNTPPPTAPFYPD